jgi:hypothetical protein
MTPLWIEAEDDLLRLLLHNFARGGRSEVFCNYQEMAGIINQHAPGLGIRQREYTIYGIKFRVYELHNKIEYATQAGRVNSHARLPTLHHAFLNEEAVQTFNLLKIEEKADQRFIGGSLDDLSSNSTKPYKYPGDSLLLLHPRAISIGPARERPGLASERAILGHSIYPCSKLRFWWTFR